MEKVREQTLLYILYVANSVNLHSKLHDIFQHMQSCTFFSLETFVHYVYVTCYISIRKKNNFSHCNLPVLDSQLFAGWSNIYCMSAFPGSGSLRQKQICLLMIYRKRTFRHKWVTNLSEACTGMMTTILRSIKRLQWLHKPAPFSVEHGLILSLRI